MHLLAGDVNVRVREDGGVKVLDFGLAAGLAESMSRYGTQLLAKLTAVEPRLPRKAEAPSKQL